MTSHQQIADHDESNPPTLSKQPSLLDAARTLLEARENEMVTRVEWDNLKVAGEAAEN